MPDLLLELLSEEIPARMQARAADDLRRLITDGLAEAGLAGSDAAAFATPRRLCLSVADLPAATPALKEERRGPRAEAPEKALAGFLRATGLRREQLELRETPKGRFWHGVIEQPSRSAEEVLAELVPATLARFPWPKSMRWGAGRLRWVRPLQSVLCILSDQAGARVVPLQVEGVPCGDTTAGHRFMAPARFAVTGFEDYADRLQRAFVILDAGARADHIDNAIRNQAFARGLEPVADRALLAEVAGLVEWPVVLVGEIAPEFLELPAEVLQTSMKTHQKFFSLRNPENGRIEAFATVANRETADGGATILAGNRKVLAARLSDAKFFWENDLRVVREAGMRPWRDSLAEVTFHNRLGSQAARVGRIAALSREIAPLVGADAGLAEQAALAAKADLASEMVGEFPELQGVMGRYYAEAAGLPGAVAAACADHYAPQGPADEVPSAPVSVALALADRLDMLTGFWTIDEKPTGSKDPFALRRAALGVIRLVLENRLRFSLAALIAAAGRILAASGGPAPAAEGDAVEAGLLAFFHDRLKVHLRDRGIRHDVIDACLAMPGNDDLLLLLRRATALAGFLDSADGENLLQGFRRANNILGAEEKKDGVSYEGTPEPRFAEAPAEKALFAALDAAEAALEAARAAEDFPAAMAALAALRGPIDAFFEAVQVNADSPVLRRNRLCLLNRIRMVMGSIARFERIGG